MINKDLKQLGNEKLSYFHAKVERKNKEVSMQETMLNGESKNIISDNIEKIKSMFPEVFNEDKIDFEKLQNVLGNYVDNEDEKYRFTWNGKMDALRLSQTPSLGALNPCKNNSIEWDTTKNLYIEGDNLEVLKLLQNSYINKIKMIYIDPPYNTGSDFVYKDSFQDTLQNYKAVTGQIDSEGNATSTNSDSSGRYHTNWLNMMYPRLRLARNLLTDDGAIFISIDDNEVENLKKICNEIFGEANFINLISLNAKVSAGASGGGEDKKLKKNIEYILLYAKNADTFPSIQAPYKDTELMKYIEQMKKDNKSFKYTNVLYSVSNEEYFSTIKDGDGNDITINKINNYDIKTVKQIAQIENITEKEVYYKYFEKIMTTTNAQTSIRDRVWEATGNENDMYRATYTPRSGKNKGKSVDLIFMGKQKVLVIWLKDSAINIDNVLYKREKVGTYWDGFSWINVSKEGSIKFDNGKKPIALIQQMINIFPDNKNMIILDFFSGSASTAHACMQSNLDNELNNQFIMVQIPQPIEPSSKSNKEYIKYLAEEGIDPIITEVAKARLKRAGDKIKEEIESGNQQLKLGESPKTLPDIGFKVFKLDTSNIKKWNPETKDIKHALLESIDNYVEGRTEDDVLYEIILKCGINLTVPIQELNICDKKVYSVAMGALIICLDNNITQDVANEIARLDSEFVSKDAVTVVFKDNGFANDSVKTNVKETIRAFGIGKFVTV